MNLLHSGDLRIVPIFGIDFSCSASEHHQSGALVRTLTQLAQAFANITNVPIFGFSAKTSPHSLHQASLFPLSRHIRNPFTPNWPQALAETYDHAFSSIEYGISTDLLPILILLKQLGMHVQSVHRKKAKTNAAMRNTLDSFYVMYLITAGEVSDLKAVQDLVQLREWHTLPVKLHVVSFARTKSTDSLEKTFSEVNATRGWS